MKKYLKTLGFSLIELMVIIAILGLLAGLVSGNFINSLKKGRDAKRKADLEQIQRALEMYYEDNRAYPTTINFGGSICHPEGCSTKNYMQKVPQDPSGSNYGYSSDSNGSYYRLYACLENNQQVLPYISLNYSGVISCSTNCQSPNNTSVPCVWGISSPNTNP